MKKNIKKDVIEFKFDLKDNILAMQLYSFAALILMGWKMFFGDGSTWDNNAGMVLGVLSIVGGVMVLKYRKLNGKEMINLNWQSIKVKDLKLWFFEKEREVNFKDVKSIRLTATKIVIEEDKKKTVVKVQYIEKGDFKSLQKYLEEISRKYRIQVKSL